MFWLPAGSVLHPLYDFLVCFTGRPERGASLMPSSPLQTKLRRHLLTVTSGICSWAAIC